MPADLTANNREYAMLGKECDIMIGTYDQATIRNLVQAIYLGQYHFEIAMRNDNPLAQKTKLSLADLAGQTLLMVPAGVSEKNDELKRAIQAAAPDAQIKYTAGRYDLETFNKAVNENLLLINLTPWKYLHPELVSIPLATSITVDYGILAAKKALPGLNNFLAMLARLV
ncbi:MAG: LysR substrate-binding domain-containing protein [Limosilactobacillus sp.]